MRLRAQVEIEPEQHTSHVVLGDGTAAFPRMTTARRQSEVLDSDLGPPSATTSSSGYGCSRARLAGAGRSTTASSRRGRARRARVSFTKGCYPGQEPIARLHYRGRANRGLRILEIDGDELPAYDAELSYEGKVVGRVTTAVHDNGRIAALAYVRREVPDNAELEVGDASARALDSMTTRP